MDAINKHTHNDNIEDKEKEENLNGIPVSEDEPIYAISDFEGRYDYYIRFLIDIGFLDKEKLKKIIIENCKTQKDKEICNAFFNENINNFLKDFLQDTTFNKNDIKENEKRICWLQNHLKPSLIRQAINKSFTGKIVVNGDLYSDRHKICLMTVSEYNTWPTGERTISAKDVIKLVQDTNQLCYELLTNLNTYMQSFTNNNNNKSFLIAGNHDLYVSDTIKTNIDEDYLKNIKNDTLNTSSLLKFAKFKIGNKTIVFKHSPHLSKDALGYIERNNYMVIEDEQIRRYPNDTSEEKHSYYWKYANDEEKKSYINGMTIFCNKTKENAEIDKQLQENNYYMVFGHCGITASNSSTYSIIDKGWDKYQYSKFSIDKKQLKHEVYDTENNIKKTYTIKTFEGIKIEEKKKKFENTKLSKVSNEKVFLQLHKKKFDKLNTQTNNSMFIECKKKKTFDNARLSPQHINKMYIRQQKKNVNILEVKEQERFSIKNNGLKKEQSTKTEHEMNFQYQSRPSLNNVDKSNSCFNSCWDKIYNICG